MAQLGSVFLCGIVTQISPLPITTRKYIREREKKVPHAVVTQVLPIQSTLTDNTHGPGSLISWMRECAKKPRD